MSVDRALFYVIPTEPFFMSSRQSPFYVILTERSDEGSRDLSHTFKMTLVVVRDDIESGAR